MVYPIPEDLTDFSQYLRMQGKAEGTIREYVYILKAIPQDVETYFSNPSLRNRSTKVFAYRAYLKYLTMKKKILTREQLLDIMDVIKPKTRRGNKHSDKKWSIPKTEWATYIRQVPSRVGKMGTYLGFHFGLRLSEILHLRVQDINFKEQVIYIRSHKKAKGQEAWTPKYNREREIPFTSDHAETLKRWISEFRPSDLPHPYVLFNTRGSRQDQIVLARTFQRWCNIAGLHPHVLRYSFATHWYNESKDVKLISELLGHANVSTTSEYLQLGKKETRHKARQLFQQA